MALKKQYIEGKDKAESKDLTETVSKNTLIELKKKQRYPQKKVEGKMKGSKSVAQGQITNLDQNQSLK